MFVKLSFPLIKHKHNDIVHIVLSSLKDALNDNLVVFVGMVKFW
jgi:hypothetical protein